MPIEARGSNRASYPRIVLLFDPGYGIAEGVAWTADPSGFVDAANDQSVQSIVLTGLSAVERYGDPWQAPYDRGMSLASAPVPGMRESHSDLRSPAHGEYARGRAPYRDPLNRVHTPTPDDWYPRMVVTAAAARPASGRQRLAMIDDASSLRAEHFRLLCHRLDVATPVSSLAVAAPYDGIEATQCAVELALAYAESCAKLVLLVEIDTHRPRLATTIGLDVERCFTDQVRARIAGKTTPWRAVSAHRSNLHVLANSPMTPPKARLTQSELRVATNELDELGYGLIIYVCPRLLDSANVALLTGTTEGAVLTGAVGKIKGKDLRDAARALHPTKVLGVALLER